MSKDSVGDGEYWIDPEGNGKSLKVFCDMTTAGGKLSNNEVGLSCSPFIREFKKLRRRLQRKRHFKIELCDRLSV